MFFICIMLILFISSFNLLLSMLIGKEYQYLFGL